MPLPKAVHVVIVLFLSTMVAALILKYGRDASHGSTSTRVAVEPPVLSELPRIWTTPGDYEASTEKSIGTYKQSPYFDQAVAEGRLPPVSERLPDEPLVVLGVQGIGEYGGTYIEASLETDGALEQSDLPQLMWWKHNFQKPYPNLIKSFKMTRADGREYVMRLRKGLRWSDGHPYTADDILFLVYDIAKYAPFEAKGGAPHGHVFRDVDVERIDDHTLRWTFGQSMSPMRMSSIFYLAAHHPAHWLKQFHPRHVGQVQVDNMVRAEGFDTELNWFIHHLDRYHRHDLGKPSMDAWVTARFAEENHSVGVFRRNPYYFAVDPEGNQLPYMDERHVVVTPSEAVAQLRALNGDLSFHQMPLRHHVVAMKAQQSGKVRVIPWTGSALNLAAIQFNVTHADPVIRALYRDKRFKHGVSHALDRRRMSELLYHGMGEPWQVAPDDDDPFYHATLATTAIQFDRERANELLDAAGLDRRDDDGYRLRADGEPLAISLLSIEEGMDAAAELIVDDLASVGLRMIYRRVDWAARSELHQTNRLDAVLWHNSYGTNGGTFMMWPQNAYLPHWWGCNWAPRWQQWVVDPAQGEQPTPVIRKALDHYEKSRSTLNLEENQSHWKAILDIAADNLWSIGTLMHPGDLAVLAPYMRNVPNTRLSIQRGDWGRQDVWWIDEGAGG